MYHMMPQQYGVRFSQKVVLVLIMSESLFQAVRLIEASVWLISEGEIKLAWG